MYSDSNLTIVLYARHFLYIGLIKGQFGSYYFKNYINIY